MSLQNKVAVKVTKKVKYAMALYHKMNATRSIFYMESFMLFSKSVHLLDYAAPLSLVLKVDCASKGILFKIICGIQVLEFSSFI